MIRKYLLNLSLALFSILFILKIAYAQGNVSERNSFGGIKLKIHLRLSITGWH